MTLNKLLREVCKMSECVFCTDYKFHKENRNLLIHYDYFAAMVIKSIIDGREKGRLTLKPRKLVYCPSCGKKL
jgi:hypothetical protein